MKYLKIISLIIVLFTTSLNINAQERPTLFLGGNVNTFNSNTEESAFLKSDFGLNIGYFTPLRKGDRFNIGLAIFGQYGTVNEDFDNLNNRFIVLPQEDTSSETLSNKVNQSLVQLGFGPQFNFKIGNTFWISPILQVGYFNFNQDELILTQRIEFAGTGDPQTSEKEVFKQNKISEGGVFFKPAIKLSFKLSQRLSLWGEANYFVAQLNTTQSQLIPLGEPNEHGAYFLDQIMGSQEFSTVDNKQELNGFGLSFGVAYNFGTSKNKAQDYNAARSNKPSSIVADLNGDNIRQANLMARLIHPPNAIIYAGSIMLTPDVQRPLNEGQTNVEKDNKSTVAVEQRYRLEPISNSLRVAQAQDYKAARSNRPTSIADSGDLDVDTDSIAPAQDYNAARSNKPSSIADSGDIDVDTDSIAPAQDYNSSRSNKPSSIADSGDLDVDTDSIAPAQDYNSSRSNRPTSIADIGDLDVDTDSIAPAQDYNAARSNRPTSIADSGDLDVDTDSIAPAQDYNAARSNKPSSIADSGDLDVDTDSIAPAQDYNAARSNKPSSIADSGDSDSDGFPNVLANAFFNISKRSAREGLNQNLTKGENSDVKGLHFDLEIYWRDLDSDDDAVPDIELGVDPLDADSDGDGLFDGMESGITYSISKQNARTARNPTTKSNNDHALTEIYEWTYDLKTVSSDRLGDLISGAKLVVLFVEGNWHIDLQLDPEIVKDSDAELLQNSSFSISKRSARTGRN